MRHVFQLIDQPTGRRTEHFTCELGELEATLRKSSIDQEAYVLLIATEYEDEKNETQLQISRAPLIQVKTLLKTDEEKAANG